MGSSSTTGRVTIGEGTRRAPPPVPVADALGAEPDLLADPDSLDDAGPPSETGTEGDVGCFEPNAGPAESEVAIAAPPAMDRVVG